MERGSALSPWCLAGVVSVEVAVRQKCFPSVATVRIPSNATYAALLDSLRSGGVERVGVVDFWGRVRRLDSSFKGGNYRFGTDATPRSLVGRLRSGDQTPVRITFNNVGSLGLLASRLSTQIEADSATIAAHLLAPETAENYGFSTETFLSMFIPDTYEVWWTLSPKALTDRMKTEYDRFLELPRPRRKAQRAETYGNGGLHPCVDCISGDHPGRRDAAHCRSIYEPSTPWHSAPSLPNGEVCFG